MDDNSNRPIGKTDKELSFSHKVWIVVGILALTVCVILILRVAFNVLLMVFAGSLIATFFHGFADMIRRFTRWRRAPCVIVSVVGTFALLGTLFWFMGSTIQGQISSLKDDFPKLVATAQEKLKQSEIGAKIVENASSYDSTKLMSTAQSFFSTSFGVIGDLYIILFLGIFFTSAPSLYKNGIIKLVPPTAKQDAHNVLNRMSLVLKGWMKGMLLAMCLIAVLTMTGLSILSIPMALTLALLAGLLNFIPNFGPLMAMVPAILLGLLDSTNTAIIIAIMYIGIQTLESNIITPMVQKRMIDLPPALTIISQVLMGTLSGVLGILLATPLLAVVIVLVDELYVKKQKARELA